jgi:hypothetical protein
LVTILFFQARSRVRSICGGGTTMPQLAMSAASSMTSAACKSALGNAADVQAHATENPASAR